MSTLQILVLVPIACLTFIKSQENFVSTELISPPKLIAEKTYIMEKQLQEMALEMKHLQTRLEHYSITCTGTTGGSTYVRWGRKSGPTTSELVYDGYAGGGLWSHSGAGTNYLCLPKNPEWASPQSPRYYSHVYGAEYETHDSILDAVTDHDAPCAVCRANRTTVLMIPAKRACSTGWIRAYYGVLMTEKYKHASSKEFVCMDGSPETLTGTYVNRNGALFYFQKAACGSLPCDPYISGRELTCVVCTK